ncbi:MAG: DUF3231 family protein [Negativicutes bacterium]|nr:DUF3231 family protein [Negativicutes bacterium]
MTMIDQIKAGTRNIVQSLVDNEPINAIEAGALYSIVIQGRYHVSLLSILHNHAQDPALKQLIAEAQDDLAESTVRRCENLLQAGEAKVPDTQFPTHPLEDRLNIPTAAHLSDAEIAMTLVVNDAAGQTALLLAIHQCYQLEVAMALRDELNKGLDWSYRLLQLMLHRGWLPEIAKVTH